MAADVELWVQEERRLYPEIHQPILDSMDVAVKARRNSLQEGLGSKLHRMLKIRLIVSAKLRCWTLEAMPSS